MSRRVGAPLQNVMPRLHAWGAGLLVRSSVVGLLVTLGCGSDSGPQQRGGAGRDGGAGHATAGASTGGRPGRGGAAGDGGGARQAGAGRTGGHAGRSSDGGAAGNPSNGAGGEAGSSGAGPDEGGASGDNTGGQTNATGGAGTHGGASGRGGGGPSGGAGATNGGAGATSGGAATCGAGAANGGGTSGGAGTTGHGGASGGGGLGGVGGTPAGGNGGIAGSGLTSSGGTVSSGNGGVAGESPSVYTPPLSAESCNGIDDDSDGNIDNLGTFTCGLGACERTVTACVGGVLQHCIAGTPTSGPDGCDGIDNDCDGAVDEDCGACVHVAPDGNDVAAVASHGSSAFASVQAAIDFADAHHDVATQVCVAAGATCGLTATFAGPIGSELQMADGIDVFANYESTTYTRCANSTTHLAPQTAPGVVFGSDITHGATLDGFSIDRTALEGVTGVTVDGAHGARLTNLTITGASGDFVDMSYGVNVVNGGDALVAKSRIDNGHSFGGAAVRASGARVSIEDNCSTALDASGRCTTTCSSTGPELDALAGVATAYHRASIVELADAPGSRIERSAFCDRFLVNDQDGIRVSGDATGLVIRGNDVETKASTDGGNHSLDLEDCAGASPWVVDNSVITMHATNGGGFPLPASSTLRAAGDCDPVIEQNTITGQGTFATTPVVHCDTVNDVGSRCVITQNPSIQFLYEPSSFSSGAGASVDAVRCDGPSCTRIDHNSITGFSSALCHSSNCGRAATALVLAPGAATFVSSNLLAGGSAAYLAGVGVSAAGGGARIENNVIIGVYGTPGYAGQLSASANQAQRGFGFVGYADVSSNYITGSVPSGAVTSACDSYGLSFGVGGTFRNNVITAGGCGASLLRSSNTQHPDVFEHNALYNGPVGTATTTLGGPLGALMLTSGNLSIPSSSDQYLSTVAGVEALPELNASGTLGADCAVTSDFHLSTGSACIDAGSVVKVPLLDRDGDARSDGKPDIGPDEVLH